MTDQNRITNTEDPIDETRLQLAPANDAAGPLDDAPRGAEEGEEDDDEFDDDDEGEDEETEDGDEADLGEQGE